jgi:hypothetical protein
MKAKCAQFVKAGTGGRMLPALLGLMLLTGCSSDPSKPNGWDRAGNSVKRGFTAVRVGTGLLVKEYSLFKLTLANTGTVTAQVSVWDNNPPVPNPEPLTIQTGQKGTVSQ